MINRLKNGYSILPNHVFKLGLSLKALGLYSYMNSKSTLSDWQFSRSGLVHELIEGEKAIASAIKELRDVNLLVIVPRRQGMSFMGHIWILNPTEEDVNASKAQKTPEYAKKAYSEEPPIFPEQSLMEYSVTEHSATEHSETACSIINTDKPIIEEVITDKSPLLQKEKFKRADSFMNDIKTILDMKDFLIANNKNFHTKKQHQFKFYDDVVSISDKGIPYSRLTNENLSFEKSDKFYEYLLHRKHEVLSIIKGVNNVTS